MANFATIPGLKRKDIEARWFNNPQYILTCQQNTKVYISLSQDGHSGNTSNYQLGFILLKRKKKTNLGRAWRANPSKIVATASDNYFQSSLPQREVNKGNIELDHR